MIQRAADVMGVPWMFLVGYAEEPDIYQLPIPSYEEYLDFARQYPGEYDVPEDANRDDSFEIAPEDIPTGDSVEDRRARQKIISRFYHYWKRNNPEHRKYNDDLQDYIYINHISLVETAGRASLTYLSTLAVLQLDAILRYAKRSFEDDIHSLPDSMRLVVQQVAMWLLFVELDIMQWSMWVKSHSRFAQLYSPA